MRVDTRNQTPTLGPIRNNKHRAFSPSKMGNILSTNVVKINNASSRELLFMRRNEAQTAFFDGPISPHAQCSFPKPARSSDTLNYIASIRTRGTIGAFLYENIDVSETSYLTIHLRYIISYLTNGDIEVMVEDTIGG